MLKSKYQHIALFLAPILIGVVLALQACDADGKLIIPPSVQTLQAREAEAGTPGAEVGGAAPSDEVMFYRGVYALCWLDLQSNHEFTEDAAIEECRSLVVNAAADKWHAEEWPGWK